jgi:hypothetical protein
MKNKRLEQAKKRDEVKSELKIARNKKKNDFQLKRNLPSKEVKKSFLIVCEGKNTEPDYFSHFKLKTGKIEAVGLGRNTLSLVEKANDLKEKGNYDQVWCVFDADPTPDNLHQITNFNNAIKKTEQLKMYAAWSNQAFEYWLLLHFEDHQGGAMSRDEYYDKINGYLKPFGVKYNKESKQITDKIFSILQGKVLNNKSRQDLAISRARSIQENHQDNTPANSESSTTVFQLVEEIMRYI